MSADPKPPFWLVWRRGGRPPVFEHPSYQAARTEAERLAQANPGSEFYVLAPAARGCTSDQVYWSHYAQTGLSWGDDEGEHAPPIVGEGS